MVVPGTGRQVFGGRAVSADRKLGMTDRKHRCHRNTLVLQVPPNVHVLNMFSSKFPKHLSDGCSADLRGWSSAGAGGTSEVLERVAST